MLINDSFVRLAYADLHIQGFEDIKITENSPCSDNPNPDLTARIGTMPFIVTAVANAQLEQQSIEMRWRSLHQSANHANGCLIAYVNRNDEEVAQRLMRHACGDALNAQIWILEP